MSAQDGGPAFPWTLGNHPGVHGPDCGGGMTQREYLEAEAMGALIIAYGAQGHFLSKMASEIADVASSMADAMLAERQKGAQG